jgi:predicted aconitase with swiveling domain
MESQKMKLIKGRVVNGGSVKGNSVVISTPFSFILDFDVYTGGLTKETHENLAGKILVCPSGKGGTVDPYVAYDAKIRGTGPLAILCQEVDPIIALSAITIDIPILDRFDVDIVGEVKTGDYLEIDGETGNVLIF